MQVLHFLGLIVGLAAGFTVAGAEDEKKHKKTTSTPSYQPAKPATTSPSMPREFTRPPYTPRTERDYEPWRANRQSTPAKSKPSTTPRTQAVTNKPEPRDPALARCDAFKARMERVIREEQRGGDPARMKALAAERQQIYQDTQRAGC